MDWTSLGIYSLAVIRAHTNKTLMSVHIHTQAERDRQLKEDTAEAALIAHGEDFIAAALFTKATAYCIAARERLQGKHNAAQRMKQRGADKNSEMDSKCKTTGW